MGLSFMATPAQLMKVVSEATGVPLATIVDIDRRLVKGKLRTKHGRGLHAAQMTPLDSARLLTAVLASAQANASVEAVERYTQTRVDEARSSERLFDRIKVEDLNALPASHSFVDGLAALIASASTGALAKLLYDSSIRWLPRIEVFAFAGAARGRIRIAEMPDGGAAIVEYIPAPLEAKEARGRKTRRRRDAGESTGDLEQSRRVTEQTILMVAELLGQE
jgi:hypothetical protein